MKALDKLHDISNTLAAAGTGSPDKEAEIILRNGLLLSLVVLYRDNPELDQKQITALDDIVCRRINHEPLQYILGNVEFMGLNLHVGKGVLIPRPETELMAEHAIKQIRVQGLGFRVQGKSGCTSSPINHYPSILTILDLCTGSGCLSLALAKAFPEAMVYASDISGSAIKYAGENAETNGVVNVTFLKGSLFEPVEQLSTLNATPYSFDLIISNPPYIRTGDIKTLQPEIRDWEPLNALDGGTDGLDYYRAIVPAARKFLKKNGMLMLELSIGCSDAVVDMMKESGYSGIELLNDYAGIGRIAVAIYAGQDTRPAPRSTAT